MSTSRIAGVTAVVMVAALLLVATAGANATQGQPVIAGQVNTETNFTEFINSTGGPLVGCVGATTTPFALVGCSTGVGVSAWGEVTGLEATGGNGTGVYANGGVAGVKGNAFGTGNGVWGVSGSGSGVYGETDGSGYGVLGYAPNAVGVRGQTTGGTGVSATATTGTALSVSGKAQFSRSGVVTIAYPAKTAVVSNVPVTAKTLAFATIQKFLSGTYVVAAVPNVGGSSNSFTIHLNKAPGSSTTPKSVTVAWYLVERP